MNKSEFESLLARLQDSTRYLLKADGLALAGLVTLASVFKVAPNQVLGLATSAVWAIKFIVWLILGLLALEAILVLTSRGDGPATNNRQAFFFRLLYALLIFLHMGAAAYTLGYVVGFLEQHAHG